MSDLFPSDKSVEILRDFGLTANQAKVYLAIARLGMGSVGQISKVSKVRREDVYRIIPRLEKLGLTERLLGTPNKIRATPLDDALSTLIKREQDMAIKKASELKAKKEELMKHFNSERMKPTLEEGAHFALISQGDQVIKKGLTIVKSAQKEVDVITSSHGLIQLFTDYTDAFKAALRKGLRVRLVAEMPENLEALLRIVAPKLEALKPRGGSIEIKYTDQSSGRHLIADNKQAMVAASAGTLIGEGPYLWTDDSSLVGLMQTNFEEVWGSSVNADFIQTNRVSEKVTHFVGELKPRDHVIFVYQSREAKHNVLFNYLKIGLENGESAAYVASEETPDEIRKSMREFGINVDTYEKKGALHILKYTDIYIVDGKVDLKTIMSTWNRLHKEALEKGFKTLRVTGEMSCFFEHGLIEQLVEYERSLHRVLELPIMAICAYNGKLLAKAKNPIDLYTELVRAHGAVLFAGVDDKLGKIEIRKA